MRPEETIAVLKDFKEYELYRGLKPSTVIRKTRRIGKYLLWIGDKYRKSDREVIFSYLEELKEAGISPELYNMTVTALKDFYSYLLGLNEILINPVEDIERIKIPPVSKTPYLSYEEIVKLIDSIPDTKTGKRDKAILELFYSSGLRVMELVNLELEDIDLANGELIVRFGKNDSSRMVPVGKKAVRMIRKYLEIRPSFINTDKPCEALFLNRFGASLYEGTIRKMINRRKLKAGIESEGVCHSLRTSCATDLINNGAPLSAVKEILGHRTCPVTTTYARVEKKYLKKVCRNTHPLGKKILDDEDE